MVKHFRGLPFLGVFRIKSLDTDCPLPPSFTRNPHCMENQPRGGSSYQEPKCMFSTHMIQGWNFMVALWIRSSVPQTMGGLLLTWWFAAHSTVFLNNGIWMLTTHLFQWSTPGYLFRIPMKNNKFFLCWSSQSPHIQPGGRELHALPNKSRHEEFIPHVDHKQSWNGLENEFYKHISPMKMLYFSQQRTGQPVHEIKSHLQTLGLLEWF